MPETYYLSGPVRVVRGPPGPAGTTGPTGPSGPLGPTGSGSIEPVITLIKGDGGGAGVDSGINPDDVTTLVANTSGTNTGDQTDISGNAATVTTIPDLTGDVTTSGNVTTLANVPADAVHDDDPTVVNLNEGGWTKYEVAVSDPCTGQTLQDITALVSDTLSESSRYEIEAKLIFSISADATGMKLGVHGGGGGGSATVLAIVTATTSSATTASSHVLNTIDTAGAAILTAASVVGIVTISGFVTTRSDPTVTISIRQLKVTSGTCTCLPGSVMRLRKT